MILSLVDRVSPLGRIHLDLVMMIHLEAPVQRQLARLMIRGQHLVMILRRYDKIMTLPILTYFQMVMALLMFSNLVCVGP